MIHLRHHTMGSWFAGTAGTLRYCATVAALAILTWIAQHGLSA